MRFLLIEDDRYLIQLLTFQLKQEGFLTDVCTDGDDALDYIEQNIYDIILLDRMLPHVDGISILKELRHRNIHTPVIILTALGEVDDRVTGLDAGADDYIVKPFDFKELMARIRSVCRRPAQYEEKELLCFGDINYEPETNHLSGSKDSCTLSRTEGALLELFLRHPAQTLSRTSILSHIWGPYGEVGEGNIDNYIHLLRRRLRHTSSQISICTIRGVGYQCKQK